MSSAEHHRLEQNYSRKANWTRWGPYLSERQWATVREDYSPNGEVWSYFPHDHARSRAYRWGEDGLLGFCDRECRLCFCVGLWNHRDAILKERLFGLTGPEGNHGEDVKEEYFYLESTPTHSYARALYKYPQAAFPYERLVRGNASRSVLEGEEELRDTGVFDNDEYWDVFAEYAKSSPDCVVIRLKVCNRAHQGKAQLTVLPQLWFRNTWSWGLTYKDESDWGKPKMELTSDGTVALDHATLGPHEFECVTKAPDRWLFTENHTNAPKLFGVAHHEGYHYKDAFHEYIVNGNVDAVSRTPSGTKGAAVYVLTVEAQHEETLEFCLRSTKSPKLTRDAVLDVFSQQKREHDEFYSSIMSHGLTDEEKNVFQQAAAGMLWSKQFYFYAVKHWMDGDPLQPSPPEQRKKGRNAAWANHFFARDVLSMPDKWEYPFFATWDLAFHMIAFSVIDIEFAKAQLLLLCREWYMSPAGELPAYEFQLGDANPPVHAYACWKVYRKTQELAGDIAKGDRVFLAAAFHKLLLNWSWWVNRKDPDGKNVFGGGFLGLDNVSVFDRSNAELPAGFKLEQADGTAWMAFFCNNMFKIAMELAHYDKSYEDIASKFFEHFVGIADAMNKSDGSGLFDEESGFYCDHLRHPDGKRSVLGIRSVVGLVPLFSVINVSSIVVDHMEGLKKRTLWFIANKPELTHSVKRTAPPANNPMSKSPRSRPAIRIYEQQKMHSTHHHSNEALFQLSIPSRRKLNSILSYVFDSGEFLSPYGVRSLSRHHLQHPFVFKGINGVELRVDYAPGESTTKIFGGNSNWRGPVWFPTNFLLIEALERLSNFYGDSMSFQFNGKQRSIADISLLMWERLVALFLPDANTNQRPCHGGNSLFTRPHWNNLVLFYEFFHGESGKGLGASHQTGWTGLVLLALNRIGEARLK